MKLYFYPGKENTEFWELLDQLRNKGKCLNAEWQGDFYVSTYEFNNQKYIYEEDMDLGIPYSIESVEEETNEQ